MSAILQRREIQLFVSNGLIHWIIYATKKKKKHALCNHWNNETFAHYNVQFCDAFLEKHVWKPHHAVCMHHARVNLCMRVSVRCGISPWNIAELSTSIASVSVCVHMWLTQPWHICKASCISICSKLPLSMVHMTWLGSSTGLRCNTWIQQYPVLTTTPSLLLKQANTFFLSDCFAVAAHWRKWKEGWQSTVQIWMYIS